jgi:hypothetical protein
LTISCENIVLLFSAAVLALGSTDSSPEDISSWKQCAVSRPGLPSEHVLTGHEAAKSQTGKKISGSSYL